MWKFLYVILVGTMVRSENNAGWQRTMSPGVKSNGYSVIYGDEDIAVINDVVDEVEKKDFRHKPLEKNPNISIKPLPAQDVKCLMSVDRYCSKDMLEIKNVLIEAIKNECKDCDKKQKENAGKVAAAMMAYDATAWKLFLTRSVAKVRPPKTAASPKVPKLKIIGKIEEIESKLRYTMPGTKIRVKRWKVDPEI